MIKLNLASVPGFQGNFLDKTAKGAKAPVREMQPVDPVTETITSEQTVEMLKKAQDAITNLDKQANSKESSVRRKNTKAATPRNRKKSFGFGKLLLTILIIAAVGTGAYFVYIHYYLPNTESETEPVTDLTGTVSNGAEYRATEPEEPVVSPVLENQIADAAIQTILTGRNNLNIVADLIGYINGNVQVNQLSMDPDKFKFVFYCKDKMVGQDIQKYISSSFPSLTETICVFDQESPVPGMPVKMIGIYSNNPVINNYSSDIFTHLDDQKIARYLGYLGQNAGIYLEPLRISTRNPGIARTASLTGSGPMIPAMEFINGLALETVNYAVNSIDISGANGTLNINILGTLFPFK